MDRASSFRFVVPAEEELRKAREDLKKAQKEDEEAMKKSLAEKEKREC